MRTFDFFGDSARFDIQTSRTCFDGQADFEGATRSASRCEWADTRARVVWNFYGAPALKGPEFRKQWTPGFAAGASVQVEIPTGDYNPDNVISAGTNRWMVRPGVGMSYVWEGWYVDLGVDVKFFQDNDDYLGARLSQDPLWQAQFHVMRFFAPGAWIAVNSNYYSGGASTRDIIDLDDGLDNARLGVTVSFPLAPGHALRLNASTGVITRVGSDFDAFGVAYQYRF